MESNNTIADFVSMRENFQKSINDYFETSNTAEIIKTLKETHAGEGDKRMALEQSIRDRYLAAWNENPSNSDVFKKIIGLSVELVMKETLAPAMPITLLSDMFDTVTISVAEKLFSFVEENLSVWKSEMFFTPCKNGILRMCNDLLRRLPRAKNTSFCGQILLFLALFFPFSERSGLNIISEFNSENVTKYTDNPDVNYEGDVVTSIIPEQLTSKVNNTFYSKFWSLQDVFRNPTLCYTQAKWKEFVESSDIVLKLISNCKVSSSSRISRNQSMNQSFSMKYLTDEKLLVLQLNDVNFRRVLFLQYLILFQYLRSYIKSRSDTYDLSADQFEWIKKSTSTIQKLSKETSSDGNKFFKTVQKILERDSFWNKWKNESCPALKRKKVTVPKEPPKIIKFNYKPTLADIYQLSKTTNKMVPTNSTSKEWTITGNYLDKCKNFMKLPNLKSRIEDIMLEADPAAQIEEQYKKVGDMKFVWQTLKLYHQKGPARCFNSPAQAVPNKIPEYVEYLSKQISRDITFKAIQARIKKQAGELRVKQEESKESKDDTDKDQEMKNLIDGREKSDDDSPIKDGEEEEEDDEKMEVEEAVDLDEDVSSEEEEATSSGHESEDEQENEEMVVDEQTPNQNGEIKDNKSENSSHPNQKLVKADFEKIAKEIFKEWRKVGEKLGYKSDEIEYFSSQKDEEFDRAVHMLDVWFSNETDASPDTLFNALETLGLSEAAKLVKTLTNS